MTNTEHMELARLCAEWCASEGECGTLALTTDTRQAMVQRARGNAYRKCRRDLEAILNAATITPDLKEPCPA